MKKVTKVKKYNTGGNTPAKTKSTTSIVKAGVKAGWKPDQAGAYKAGMDTTGYVNMTKPGQPGYATVKKGMKKGGVVKTKKK
jgi:hypothetical protein